MYKITSLPSVVIHIFVAPTLLFFVTFILLADIDGECNYSRYQVRSYFPLRSTTKWKKTWREKCYVCTCTEQNQMKKEQNVMTRSFIIHEYIRLFLEHC